MKDVSQTKVVSIVGAGSWGTTIAKVIAEKYPAKRINLWALEKYVVQSVNRRIENREFLPGIELPKNIHASNSIRETLGKTDAVILAVPSKAVFEITARISRHLVPGTPFAYLTKGFCRMEDEILTISQSIIRVIPELEGKVAAVSGPSHAEEVSRGYHSCLNVGSLSPEDRSFFSELISCGYIQCRETDDIVGVDVGGTLKNPAAIAAGMISRLPYCGDNLAGALISEALKEMLQLGTFFKARRETLVDISGLGDLVATSLSDNSRNRRFGRDIALQILDKGTTLSLIDRIILRFDPSHVIERMSEKLNYLAEGAYAIEPIIELAEMENISIPVYRSLYEVLLNKKDPSLLIETIKNPEKFEELYHATKIQVGDRKRGLENIKGKIFYKFIFNRTMEHLMAHDEGKDELVSNLKHFCENAAESRGADRRESRIIRKIDGRNFRQSIEALAGLYLNEMIDHYSFFMKRLTVLYLYFCRALNRLTGQAGDIDITGDINIIRRIKTSENIVYVSNTSSLYDYLYVFYSINRTGLPSPRFFVHKKAIATRIEEMLVKMSGGVIIDPEKLGNRVYREVVNNYISILIEHGVPILFFPDWSVETDGTVHIDRFYTLLTEAMYRHTVEIALVPITITCSDDYTRGEHLSWRSLMKKSCVVNFSRQVYLSEYTKKPDLMGRLHEDLNSVWVRDRK